MVPGSSPGGRTTLRKTVPSHCFLVVRSGNMFLQYIAKTIELGPSALSILRGIEAKWLVTGGDNRLINPVRIETPGG